MGWPGVPLAPDAEDPPPPLEAPADEAPLDGAPDATGTAAELADAVDDAATNEEAASGAEEACPPEDGADAEDTALLAAEEDAPAPPETSPPESPSPAPAQDANTTQAPHHTCRIMHPRYGPARSGASVNHRICWALAPIVRYNG